MKHLPFIIVVVLGFTSWYFGLRLIGAGYTRVAPAWLFGQTEAREQNISVVRSTRHYLYFSNEPSRPVPRSDLHGLNVIVGIAYFLTIPTLFYTLVFITARVLKAWDKELATDIWLIATGKYKPTISTPTV